MQLSGPITLCGRSDGDLERHFTGDIAALSVWDSALAPWQVRGRGARCGCHKLVYANGDVCVTLG